ncbi:MAG: hypothetical protein V1867_06500 [Candidatus Falkowbacteria bacterium]
MEKRLDRLGSFHLIVGIEEGLPVLDITGLSLAGLAAALGFFSGPVILESNGDEVRRNIDILVIGHAGPGHISRDMIEKLHGSARDAAIMSASQVIPLDLIRDLETAIIDYPTDDFDHLIPVLEPAEKKKNKKRFVHWLRSGSGKPGKPRFSYQRRRV